ncbi:MAG: UDP-N-acetylmuramate dehydrogenase [Oceanospirillaceae bacterium]|nr:UDP-N-acetylmuramate dehydrogenase [Oceanospirillaceae bacterium]
MLSIETNKNIIALNTLGFNAIAEQFTAIANEADLLKALAYAQSHQLDHQVLSGGSNVLVDEHIPGLTLHMQLMGRTVIEQSDEHVVLRIGAGENWHELVQWSVENNWQGIETMALIPGLVGASPVQNIGAYGTELKDVLVKVRAWDCRAKDFVELDNSQCQFLYRDSVFKRAKGRFIITSVDFQLQKNAAIKVKYQALKDYLDNQSLSKISLADVFQAICAIRSEKLPDPAKVANAGSFFKNPVISHRQFQQLQGDYPQIVGHPTACSEIKVAAGWLIDYCGWKGYLDAGVGVYPKQALVLIHTGESTIAQLLQLAEDIKQSVYEKFRVQLEIEPQRFPSSS